MDRRPSERGPLRGASRLLLYPTPMGDRPVLVVRRVVRLPCRRVGFVIVIVVVVAVHTSMVAPVSTNKIPAALLGP